MNKYLEALDYIIDCIELKDLEAIEFYCDMVQELVDKENQMKPIITSAIPLCPRCHEETVMSTDYSMKKYGRCINEECGQKLDWNIYPT